MFLSKQTAVKVNELFHRRRIGDAAFLLLSLGLQTLVLDLSLTEDSLNSLHGQLNLVKTLGMGHCYIARFAVIKLGKKGILLLQKHKPEFVKIVETLETQL